MKNTGPGILRIEALLVYLALAIFLAHNYYSKVDPQWVKPQNTYHYSLKMKFTPKAGETSVTTYLPTSSERQTVFSESSQANYMEQASYTSHSGQVSRWVGNRDATEISYEAMITSLGYRYEISPEIEIGRNRDQGWQQYLQPTEAIPVAHPEIIEQWQKIKPVNERNLLAVLTAIYNYTDSLETLPFKGTTDSLTALRLAAASCNGKSRLFVSLARLNGIASRLVGGIVLNDGRKKTSHQWVEVNINNQWVAFDPTNHYFAELPAHYLELYRGDKSLFSHSANIDFDYQFNINSELIAPAIYQNTDAVQDRSGLEGRLSLSAIIAKLHMSADTAAIFLLLPLCALIITFLRNVVGLKSFGIFMPMLIASACSLVGLIPGLVGFSAIVLIAFMGHMFLNNLNLLKIPRLAAIITVINLATIVILALLDQFSDVQFGLLSLFPVIIISFVADKLHDLAEERDWQQLFTSVLGTLVSITLCYLCLSSALLQGLFAIYPEVFLLVLSGQIYIGRWTGIRVSESFRFHSLITNKRGVMGINARNRDYVADQNSAEGLRTAANKLQTKKILRQAGIAVPATLARFSSFSDLKNFNEAVSRLDEFVIKPNAGSQGKGILIIRGRCGENFIGTSGKELSRAFLHNHILEIINGNYSQLDDSDSAYIEPLIHQHSVLEEVAPYGLCDIRVIVSQRKIISAMLRLPTEDSGGKANLHRGAIGGAIDVISGKVVRCQKDNTVMSHHPNSQQQLVGITIPYWQEILAMSLACYRCMPLGYMGVDISLDKEQGPLVLEVNGRPGLEIQNVNQQGLHDLLTHNLKSKSTAVSPTKPIDGASGRSLADGVTL